MLSWDSEDEMWSRFVFELVIWPQEVTLARWPSGPLCLWQCFFLSSKPRWETGWLWTERQSTKPTPGMFRLKFIFHFWILLFSFLAFFIVFRIFIIDVILHEQYGIDTILNILRIDFCLQNDTLNSKVWYTSKVESKVNWSKNVTFKHLILNTQKCNSRTVIFTIQVFSSMNAEITPGWYCGICSCSWMARRRSCSAWQCFAKPCNQGIL